MRPPGRLLAVFAVGFPLACASASPTARHVAPPNLGVEAVLDEVRRTSGVPAIAAAIVRSTGPVHAAVVGVRSLAGKEPARLDDMFHIGSCTKSMTATLIATLIDEGQLSLSTPVAKVLPNLTATMRSEYRTVTVGQLLSHRSGLPPFKSPTPDETAFLANQSGSPREQRAAFAGWVLTRTPVFPPGTRYEYSNAGYGVVAHMAEVVMGKSYEDLMRERLFTPLGLKRCVFGWPATPDRPNAPYGHWWVKGALVPLALRDSYRFPPAIAPAGDVSCAIEDFADYARAHLRALRGLDGKLPAQAIRKLHVPTPIETKMPPKLEALLGKTQGAGAGWLIFSRGSGQTVSWHNGSAGTFFAWMTILPHDDLAIVVATNAGSSERACAEVTARILRLLSGSRD